MDKDMLFNQNHCLRGILDCAQMEDIKHLNA